MKTLKVWSAALALVCAGLAAEAAAKATIRETRFLGQRAVTLENRFLRVTFTPDKGAAWAEFYYKPARKQMFPPGSGRVLGERLWNPAGKGGFARQWLNLAWSYAIERPSGGVRLVLRARGSVGPARQTHFEKRVVLRDGEAMVRVTHEFFVGYGRMLPLRVGLWFDNRLGPPGERFVYRVPREGGVVTLDPRATIGEWWAYDPSRGWTGMVTAGGDGLCLEMDYRRLMAVYCSPKGVCPSLEVAFRTDEVVNDTSLVTDSLLTPFAGLKTVHGAGGGVVACLDAREEYPAAQAGKDTPFKARLVSGTPMDGELTLTLEPGPGGAAAWTSRAAVSLRPGAVTERRFAFRAPRQGTWLLRGELRRDGRRVMDCFQPVVVGRSSGVARVAPLEKRLGRPNERYQDRTPLNAKAVVPDLTFRPRITTPHVPWARPFVGGRLKVLVSTSLFNGWEAAELAQRLDMETLWVSGAPFGGAGCSFTETGDYVASMQSWLKTKLNSGCDAVILGGLRADLLSEEVIALLRKRVSEGMGLVYVALTRGPKSLYSWLPVTKESRRYLRAVAPWAPGKPHFITTGVPFDLLPSTGHVPYRATGQVLATIRENPLIVTQEGPGKGRVVVLTYNTGWQGPGAYKDGITPWVPASHTFAKYWEHHFSLLAKALVWAARREPALRLASLSASAENGAPELRVGLLNAGRGAACRAEVTVRDRYGVAEARLTKEFNAPSGSSSVRVPLGQGLPGGLHGVELILKTDPGKVAAWGAASLRTEGAVALEGLTFGKRAYYPGDTVRATARLVGNADRRPDVRVRAELRDALGRLVARSRQRVALDKDFRLEFALPLGEPLATTARLRVTAEVGGRPAAVAEAEVITFPDRFARRSWGDGFTHTAYMSPSGSYGREYLVPTYARRMKECGITVAAGSGNWLNPREHEWVVRSGLQLMALPYAGYKAFSKTIEAKAGLRDKYLKTRDKKYLVRAVCVNDPKFLAKQSRDLVKVGRYVGWLEPVGYLLGDELRLTYDMDYDYNPIALDAFREWLRKRYKTLQALNGEWGAEFAAWKDVMPMTAREVRGRLNYAPWADHREFRDSVFSGFFGWSREQLRQADPQATVGISGTQRAQAYGGYDWRRLGGTLDFLFSYSTGDQARKQRSLARRATRLPWYGWRNTNPLIRRRLWRYLLTENYGAAFYRLLNLWGPDLRLSFNARLGVPIVKEFQSGLARMLRHAERRTDVGLLYSHASIRGAFITGASNLTQGWGAVIEDAGLQCEYVDAAQVEAGELDRRAYRAFVLPYSVALSDKTAAALRRYVEQGGFLIADGRPGLMDEHCRTRDKAALDDLFGVRRPKVDPLASRWEGTARFTRNVGACRLKGLELDVMVSEPDLSLAGGEALGAHQGLGRKGTTPVLVLRRVGRGGAVLLNLHFEDYGRRRMLDIEAPLRRVATHVLALAGVTAPVRVTVEPSVHAYVVRYRDGKALYAAVQVEHEKMRKRPPEWTAEVGLAFPRAGFVYDVRGHKLLGRTDRCRTRLAEGDTAVYALLPYRVTGVRVQAAKKAVPCGTAVDYEVAVQSQGGPPGAHVVRVEALAPDGRPLDHYAATLVTRDGKAKGSFMLALDDPTGPWTLRATEYISHARGAATVRVQPALVQ